jgi:uncharacterized protein YbjT (DUF2867 family)
MRVLVTGAYGLIGSAVLARLHREGHDLSATGRRIAEAARRAPFARWIEADFNRLTTPEGWMPVLDGVDAVVNCVGVLEQGGADDVRRTHVEGTVALFDACARRGVRRVIHISAIGASPQGTTEFARTKAQADTHLATLDLDWAILRPALVMAPAVYGGTAMLRALAALPMMTPAIAGADRIQIVSIDNVTETVALLLRPGTPVKMIWEIAHPQPHTLAGIIAALRGWLGFPARPVVTMPAWLMSFVSFLATLAGMLGWRSPARPTAMKQLAAGVAGDPAPWLQATGITPKSLADILAERPAGVQERWFARLYLLKPLAIAGLALFWLLTGLVALGPGRAAAEAHLAATIVPAAWVGPTVFWGAWFDVVLGLLLPIRRFTRVVLIVMLMATPIYLAIGTWLAPQLWLDPLGPLVKIIPLLVATLVTLAILDDR